MAFVVIVDSISNTIDLLHQEIQSNTTKARNLDDPNRQQYLSLIDLNRDKLSAAIRYESIFQKKSAFDKYIKHLKTTNREKYIQKCKQLANGITGVTFDKRDLRFVVRLTRNNQRIYVGAFDTPEEALDVLQMYM